ncbi:hypothetical protein N9948_00995 [bacterium]|nr:hypothetical protein [bacterium]
MELNLRKARKLEVKIQTYLDTKALETEASVRTLGQAPEAQERVEAIRADSLRELTERNQLLDVRYGVRREIEKKNEESGINALLNDKILTERKFKVFDGLQGTPSYTTTELGDQLKAYSKVLDTGAVETDRWGEAKSAPKTSFSVPVFSSDDLENFEVTKTDFQRRLDKIDDDLSLKNLQTKVVLSEDNSKLLQSHRLL